MSSKYIILFACLFLFNFTNAILLNKVNTKGNVMVIRHAEKPISGNDLSNDGWRRAECIRDLFSANETITPKVIYAQKASKKNNENTADSRRQIETVAPLARKLDLVIDNSYTEYEVDELSKNVGTLSESEYPVLISWNHDDIKSFLINFGMKYQIAPTYPSNRYDLVFVINSMNGEVKFSSFSESCEGLGDYRYASGSSSMQTNHWVKKSLMILFITLVIYLF